MNVSKPVVISAVGAMVAMAVVIAFLLGRESGRHHAPPAAPVAPIAVGVAPTLAAAEPPAAPPGTGELPPSPFKPPPPAAPAAPAALAPAALRPPPPPLSASPDEAAQVHQYFLEVSEIQVNGTGDPNEFANKLITSSLGGDSSGFDSLITSSQDALARVKALRVPPPCAAYHAKLVKMFEDTVAMMSSLDTALKSKNTDALTAILPQANALQTQTTVLESQARELKQRYGI